MIFLSWKTNNAFINFQAETSKVLHFILHKDLSLVSAMKGTRKANIYFLCFSKILWDNDPSSSSSVQATLRKYKGQVAERALEKSACSSYCHQHLLLNSTKSKRQLPFLDLIQSKLKMTFKIEKISITNLYSSSQGHLHISVSSSSTSPFISVSIQLNQHTYIIYTHIKFTYHRSSAVPLVPEE